MTKIKVIIEDGIVHNVIRCGEDDVEVEVIQIDEDYSDRDAMIKYRDKLYADSNYKDCDYKSANFEDDVEQ